LEQPLNEQEISPEAGSSDTTLVINRVTFNYIVIVVVFFAAGIAVGMIGYNRFFITNQLENEDLINRAIAAALESQATGQSPDQVGNDPSNRFVVDVDDDPAIGPEDAPIVMIEFSDFQCPYCGRFARETLHPLLEAYEGQVRFVYRDFPILGPTSVDAALAAECAEAQDAFWEYHDLLFENQSSLGRELFIQLAGDSGLEVEQFTTCLDDKTYQSEVTADYAAAQRLGARGTPTFFINGRFVSGAMPLEYFAGIFDEELANSEAG
jgi:protein-disulfide isomerase